MMDKANLHFTVALKQARKERKLTQEELAYQTGVSLMTIRRYESGDSFPEKETLGLIMLSLRKAGLAEAWVADYKEWHPDKTISTDELMSIAASSVEEIGIRNFIVNVGRKASLEFIEQYITSTQCLLALNKRGIEKANELIGLLCKVPEYQSKASWVKQEETE